MGAFRDEQIHVAGG